MLWQQWVLIGLIGLEIVVRVSFIGKPRKVLEPDTVAIMVVLYGLLMWMVVSI